VAAKLTPAGLEQPIKRLLDGVTDAYCSKLNRLAIWTMCGEQPDQRVDHDPASCFTGVKYGARESLRGPVSPRLASRAVFRCSGVLTSGCDTLNRSLARNTWRLWRFSHLLFITCLCLQNRRVICCGIGRRFVACPGMSAAPNTAGTSHSLTVVILAPCVLPKLVAIAGFDLQGNWFSFGQP